MVSAKIQIRREDDVEWLREQHKLAFPADAWVGDDEDFWIAVRGEELLGFASSSVLVPDEGPAAVFLSRHAAVHAARGLHLQRRFIRVQEQHARRQGLRRIVTYTTIRNYPSITNLIKCGYRFTTPWEDTAGYGFHHFEKYL